MANRIIQMEPKIPENERAALNADMESLEQIIVTYQNFYNSYGVEFIIAAGLDAEFDEMFKLHREVKAELEEFYNTKVNVSIPLDESAAEDARVLAQQIRQRMQVIREQQQYGEW